MNKLEKQKLEEISEDLYNLNANISLYFIGYKNPVTENDLLNINDKISKAIRQLRELSR